MAMTIIEEHFTWLVKLCVSVHFFRGDKIVSVEFWYKFSWLETF